MKVCKSPASRKSPLDIYVNIFVQVEQTKDRGGVNLGKPLICDRDNLLLYLLQLPKQRNLETILRAVLLRYLCILCGIYQRWNLTGTKFIWTWPSWSLWIKFCCCLLGRNFDKLTETRHVEFDRKSWTV